MNKQVKILVDSYHGEVGELIADTVLDISAEIADRWVTYGIAEFYEAKNTVKRKAKEAKGIANTTGRER